MYNLLIIDDEEIAIRGITDGIDWSDMPIAKLYTAYDAGEAKELLRSKPIDIMLSDIDMPNENGIDLLRWVNEHYPDMVTLFLTGHADFNYAQQAVHLDCFDYLLKPIDHGQLKQCIANAIEKVREQHKLAEIRTTYQAYSEQWNKQRPVLVERFWQDLFHYRISVSEHQLEPMMATYSIPLKAHSNIRIVLISIEQWKEEWSARDEEIMTYGVKNAVAELVLNDQCGSVIQEGNGILYAVLYEPEQETEAAIVKRCQHFIEQSKLMLHCQLSCYISELVPVQQASAAIQLLLEQEKHNISSSGTVMLERAYSKAAQEVQPMFVPFSDWADLLTLGKRIELAYRIDECFDRMLEERADYTHIATFYYGFMNMLFGWLNSHSLQLAEVFPGKEWEEGQQALKSIVRLRSWTHQMCKAVMTYSLESGKTVSQAVEKVQRYMREHMHEEFSRELAADAVYLNPAYLSRLFRKETGRSLTDYLVELRIAKARQELANSNQRISDIAAAVGYSNFSHFSKVFKKSVGLTPQEYRKKHQNL